MEATEQGAFETDAIGRALQHDLVLRASLIEDTRMVFEWRSPLGTIGPRFEYRDLAIEWMIDWLAYDTAYGDT